MLFTELTLNVAESNHKRVATMSDFFVNIYTDEKVILIVV